MKVFSVVIRSFLIDYGIKPVPRPTDGPPLFRPIGTLVKVVRAFPELLSFFEANAARPVPAEAITLVPVEFKPHPGPMYNCYTINDLTSQEDEKGCPSISLSPVQR
jgi:hypothetical protein